MASENFRLHPDITIYQSKLVKKKHQLKAILKTDSLKSKVQNLQQEFYLQNNYQMLENLFLRRLELYIHWPYFK